MNKEQFDTVISYFTNLGIQVPTTVKNAIQDVFEENDEIENVVSYFKEDIQELLGEMKLFTTVNITLDGKSSGKMTDTWTYYGEVDFSLNEDINIVNENGESLQLITKTINEDNGIIYNENDWAVLLFEDVSWNTSEGTYLKKEPRLVIYCPTEFEQPQNEKFLTEEEFEYGI